MKRPLEEIMGENQIFHHDTYLKEHQLLVSEVVHVFLLNKLQEGT